MARTPSAEYLILDIETIPDSERWQRPEVPDGAGVFPPSWAHRVVVIGGLLLDHDYRLKRLGALAPGAAAAATADDRERALLAELSRFVGSARPVLVTFNGRRFDLPVIALRALCHGVPLRWYYRERGARDRHAEAAHLDLCDTLADHGATRMGSLDALARLIGLPGKLGVDGSQVEGLYLAGQLAAIEQYCLADVVQTALLLLRFRLLQGALAPARYRAAVAALLADLAADGRVGDVLAGIDRDRLLGAVEIDLAS